MPVIVEATKFVFGEASKWLDKFRNKDLNPSLNSAKANANENVPTLTLQEFSRLEANPSSLLSVINVQMAETNAYEIKSLVEQIQIHRRNLADHETVQAEYGAVTPQHIKRGIEREASESEKKALRLIKLLEQIYGKELKNT